MRQVVKDHLWLRCRYYLLHEVRHRLCVDVIIAGDAAHVRRVDLLGFTIETDQASSVKLLYHVSDTFQQHHVARLVVLKIGHTYSVHVWVFDKSLVKVRFF